MSKARKQVLIKKNFQLKLMAKVFGFVVAVVFLLSTSLFFTNQYAVDSARNQVSSFLLKYTDGITENAENYSAASFIGKASEMANSINDALERLDAYLLISLSVALVISIVLIITVFLGISHRIAGPVYRFEETIKQLKTGDLSVRIKLRNRDDLKELAEEINQMSDSLNDKLLGVHKGVIELKSLSEQGKLPESELKSKLETMEKSLAAFTLVHKS